MVAFEEDFRGNLTGFSIGFGGLFFHLLFVLPHVPSAQASQLRRLILEKNREQFRCTFLEPTSTSIRLSSSDRDWTDIEGVQRERVQHMATHGKDPLHHE